jgi:WD40 repeat protein
MCHSIFRRNSANVGHQDGRSARYTLGHAAWLSFAEFSPDGSRVVTASSDGTARLWDATTGAAIATLSGHTGGVWDAEFSGDGSVVATASADHTARLWDSKTGAALATLSGHTDMVFGAAFSPDGSRIVTSSADKTARVWDATTDAALAKLTWHTEWVVSSAFSPDGSRIVTASWDKTAHIWKIDPIVLMLSDQRQSYVCRERLIGAQSFTDEEMQDPILRGRNDLRNPCDRVGPLSIDYYWRAAIGLVATIRAAISK